MGRQFHDGMLARVQNDDEFSDPVPSIMFSAMLRDAFPDGDNGIPIRYRFDRKLPIQVVDK